MHLLNQFQCLYNKVWMGRLLRMHIMHLPTHTYHKITYCNTKHCFLCTEESRPQYIQSIFPWKNVRYIKCSLLRKALANQGKKKKGNRNAAWNVTCTKTPCSNWTIRFSRKYATENIVQVNSFTIISISK